MYEELNADELLAELVNIKSKVVTLLQDMLELSLQGHTKIEVTKVMEYLK